MKPSFAASDGSLLSSTMPLVAPITTPSKEITGLSSSSAGRSVWSTSLILSMALMGTLHERGGEIGLGMLKIIGEDHKHWNFHPQANTPNQLRHNQFRFDSGACGPFVFRMAEILIHYIKQCQFRGTEDRCKLQLSTNFPWEYKSSFDSLMIRFDIKKRIARWRARTIAPNIANNYDWSVIRGTGVELEDSPVVRVEASRKLKAPIPHKPRKEIKHVQYIRRSLTPNKKLPTILEDEDDVVQESSSSSSSSEISSDEATVVDEISEPVQVDIRTESDEEEEGEIVEEEYLDDDEDGGIIISNLEYIE